MASATGIKPCFDFLKQCQLLNFIPSLPSRRRSAWVRFHNRHFCVRNTKIVTNIIVSLCFFPFIKFSLSLHTNRLFFLVRVTKHLHIDIQPISLLVPVFCDSKHKQHSSSIEVNAQSQRNCNQILYTYV